MKKLLAALILLTAWQASALDLGAGLASFAKSHETAPFVSAVLGRAACPYTVTWTRDGDIEHATISGSYDVGKFDLGTVYALGGAAVVWEEWDAWKPELQYGAGLRSAVAGKFTGRLWFERAHAGGKADGENRYFAGLYLATAKGKK